jgi:cold-inducible RNA-binding protein
VLGEFYLSGSVDPIPETSASHPRKKKMSVKLYVGNLPFSMTENDLTDLFAQAGNVARVQMINDRVTGRPRGFGFVEMGTPDEAQAAIAKFHGQEINGRALTVNEARPMEQREGGGGGGRLRDR